MSNGNTRRCKLVSITSTGGAPVYLKESRNVHSQAEARRQGSNLAHLTWGPRERSAAPVALPHTGTARGAPPAPCPSQRDWTAPRRQPPLSTHYTGSQRQAGSYWVRCLQTRWHGFWEKWECEHSASRHASAAPGTIPGADECWCEPVIPGEGNWRMQGNPFISKHEEAILETVGLFTKKMNQCISCFMKAFMRGISKAAWLPCPRGTYMPQEIPAEQPALVRKNWCLDSSALRAF